MIDLNYTVLYFFFFNDTATTEIYTLSLHDALPISRSKSRKWRTKRECPPGLAFPSHRFECRCWSSGASRTRLRSEEHTSELQSRQYLVCRLLLEKKKKKPKQDINDHPFKRCAIYP